MTSPWRKPRCDSLGNIISEGDDEEEGESGFLSCFEEDEDVIISTHQAVQVVFEYERHHMDRLVSILPHYMDTLQGMYGQDDVRGPSIMRIVDDVKALCSEARAARRRNKSLATEAFRVLYLHMDNLESMCDDDSMINEVRTLCRKVTEQASKQELEEFAGRPVLGTRVHVPELPAPGGGEPEGSA